MGGLYNLQTFFGVYNFIVNTSKRVLFLPPSDAYVRSFLYLLDTLINLYYTKALSNQASSLALDWILLLRGPRIPIYSRDSTTTFQHSVKNIQKQFCGKLILLCSANSGDTGDVGLIPRSGRSPGEGNGNPLQYSCLENPRDRGSWWATGYGVTTSWTHLVTKQ